MTLSRSWSFRGRLAIAVACGCAIFWFSLVPASAVPHIPLLGWDKLQHALAYALLTLTCGRVFVLLNPNAARGWLWGLVVALTIGALLELLQGLCTTTRTPDLNDFFADAVGGISVCLAALLGGVRRGPHRKDPSR